MPGVPALRDDGVPVAGQASQAGSVAMAGSWGVLRGGSGRVAGLGCAWTAFRVPMARRTLSGGRTAAICSLIRSWPASSDGPWVSTTIVPSGRVDSVQVVPAAIGLVAQEKMAIESDPDRGCTLI